MSLPLQLSIRRGGTTYTYDNVDLLAREAQTDVEVDELDLQLASLSLWIGPKNGSQQDLAGISDPIGFPSGEQYRAKLERTDTGSVILDGAILTRDIRYTSASQSWRVTLIDQAPRDFWEQLRQTFWNDLLFENDLDVFGTGTSSVLKSRTLRVWDQDEEPFETAADPEFQKATVPCYQMHSVFEFVLDELSIGYDIPPALFAGDDGRYDGSEPEANVWMVINRWRLKTLIEQIRSYAGWRLVPAYQSFPNDGLYLDVELANYSFPSSLPAIDSDLLQEGYTIRSRKTDSWVLKVANDIAEDSPDPAQYGIVGETQGGGSFDTEFPMATFATPPAWALAAATTWTADPPYLEETPSGTVVAEGDSRTLSPDATSLRLKIPPVDVDLSLGEYKGRPLLPKSPVLLRWLSYDDDPETDVPDEDENAFLFQTEEDGSSGEYIARWGTIDEAAYPLGARASHWLRRPFRQQPQRHASARELRGQFFTDADFRVGAKEAGVEMEGKDWLVFGERKSLQDFSSDLRLYRPAETPTERDAPTVSTEYSWRVIGFRTSVVTIDRGNGKEDWLVAHWERTATESAREYAYDVQYEDDNGDLQLVSNVAATAFTRLLASAGNGGGSYTRTVKVRPVAPNQTGDYVSLNAS
jgi:hypothetical protein